MPGAVLLNRTKHLLAPMERVNCCRIFHLMLNQKPLFFLRYVTSAKNGFDCLSFPMSDAVAEVSRLQDLIANLQARRQQMYFVTQHIL